MDGLSTGLGVNSTLPTKLVAVRYYPMLFLLR